MKETIMQNGENPKAAFNPALTSWELFWRYVFSQSSLVFFFAAIVCFFAYNWAEMSVFTKFALIAGLMVLTALLPILKGIEGFSANAGLIFCGLLAGPLLAVHGQHYQTGANAWELFRTWAFFLLPLALIGRRSALWFSLWLVASLAFFLYLQQQNTLYSYRYEEWISLPFILSQIAFLVFLEAASALKPSRKPVLSPSRWLPRCVAGLILFYLMVVMSELIFGGSWWVERNAPSSLVLRWVAVYSLFLLAAAFYYTKKTHDLFILAMGLASIAGTGLMLLLYNFSRWWNSGSALLTLAAYILLASVVIVKILLFCHRLKTPEKEERTLEEAYFAPRDGQVKKAAFSLDLLSVNNFLFALKGPEAPLPRFPDKSEKKDEKPEETSHWVIPFLMGLGAWVTVPFLIAGLVVVLESVIDEEGLIVFFLLMMGLGAFFSRKRGAFANQAGLCLALAGTIGASIFMVVYHKAFFRHHELVPLVLLCILGMAIVPNRVYRLIASCTAITTFFIQLLMEMTRTEYEYLFFPKRIFIGGEGGSHWFLLTFLFSAFALGLVHFWHRPKDADKLGFLQNPILSGAFLALIILSLFFHFDASGLHLFRSLNHFANSALGLGAGAGLVWFSLLISRKLQLKKPAMAGLLAAALFLAALGFRIYWIPAGFLLLSLARYAASLPLMGLGVLFLSLMTVLEYYNQTTSLLHKSFTLAILGFFLGLFAFGLHLILQKFFQEEKEEKTAEKSEEKVKASLGGAKLSRGFVLFCLCAFLFLFAASVREKETLLATGTKVVLALRPLDPRSLMQGDYMILSLDVEDKIRSALDSLEDSDAAQLQGLVVLKPDENGVAGFLRLDDGSALAQGEIRLIYRRKSRGIQISSGAFFFQEGHGAAYDAARFAVLRVDEKGDALVTELLDAKQKLIVVSP